MKKPPFKEVAFSKSRFEGRHLENSFTSDFSKLETSWDDRPERELGWLMNPSSPVSERDLDEFIVGIESEGFKALNQDEGRDHEA